MYDLVRTLRLLAIAEGISLLVLFFIAMPMKYYANDPSMMPMVGWTHGILFMTLAALTTYVANRKNWPDKIVMQVIVASMVPFATFVMDRKLKRLD